MYIKLDHIRSDWIKLDQIGLDKHGLDKNIPLRLTILFNWHQNIFLEARTFFSRTYNVFMH